jgi:tetrahydromethanopterin S-methyltransferase subunit B
MFDFLADLFEDDVEVEGGNILEELNQEVDIPMDENLELVMESSEDVQVLYALDRMTVDIDGLNVNDIESYLDSKTYSAESWQGLVSNWKGIYGEIKVADDLNEAGGDLNYVIPAATNNPGVDIYGMDENGNIVEKIQVKMTTDTSYINSTLEELPDDVKIMCPTEVAKQFADNDQVIDAGFTHEELLDDISDVASVVLTPEPWQEELYSDDDFNNWMDTSYVYVD